MTLGPRWLLSAWAAASRRNTLGATIALLVARLLANTSRRALAYRTRGLEKMYTLRYVLVPPRGARDGGSEFRSWLKPPTLVTSHVLSHRAEVLAAVGLIPTITALRVVLERQES